MKLDTKRNLKNYKGEFIFQDKNIFQKVLDILKQKVREELEAKRTQENINIPITADQINKEINDLIIKDNGSVLSLGDVILEALNYENINPQAGQVRKIDTKQKFRSYQLSLDIVNNKEIELTSEDITFIKEGLAILYPPVTFGQVVNILENKEENELSSKIEA